MIGRLHHVEIYVNDLKKTKEFYTWFLNMIGYKEYQSWDLGFSMLLENTYIVFVQVEEKYKNIKYHRCRSGLNHLAFYGGSKEQIDIFREKLKRKGISLLYDEKYPYAGGKGYYALYFEDPDRMKLELVAEK